MPEFTEWESFYLIVGGAAAALIPNAWDAVAYHVLVTMQKRDEHA